MNMDEMNAEATSTEEDNVLMQRSKSGTRSGRMKIISIASKINQK